MNILFLDQFSEPGGAQACLLDLLPAIREQGWRAHLLAPGDGELLERCKSLGIPTASLPLRNLSSRRKTAADVLGFLADMPRAVSTLNRHIRTWRIDLLYVNGPRVLPVAATAIRRPTIFHAHSIVGQNAARKLARLAIWRLKPEIIVASRFVESSFGAMPGVRPARIIYSGAPDLAGARRSLRSGLFHVGIAGRIAPEKGHLDFVRAGRLIAKLRPDVRFHVFGASLFSGPDYESIVRAEAATIPIEFHGWSSDIAQTLGELDILVMPSAAVEAAPRIIMEALSAGTPVVAYPSGGIPELLDNGRTGILTAGPHHESLAASILDLIAQPERMTNLAIAGREEWRTRFRVERYQAEVCEVIESVWRSRRSSLRQSQALRAIDGIARQ